MFTFATSESAEPAACSTVAIFSIAWRVCPANPVVSPPSGRTPSGPAIQDHKAGVLFQGGLYETGVCDAHDGRIIPPVGTEGSGCERAQSRRAEGRIRPPV